MITPWNWLLNTLAKTLDPREREVVLGDIAELGLSDRQAAAGIFGLVVRRAAQPWKHFRPWLVLIGVILPISLLLANMSRELADGNSVYLWMYTANWTATYLNPGYFWSELVPQLGTMGLSWLILACWSWMAGFAIATCSRVAAWTSFLIAAAVLLAVTSPAIGGHAFFPQPAYSAGNDPVFANTFYRIIFPFLLQTLLVLLPCAYGLRTKRRAA